MVTRLRNRPNFTYHEPDAMPGDGLVNGEPLRAEVDVVADERDT
jgi:hypothetical protein